MHRLLRWAIIVSISVYLFPSTAVPADMVNVRTVEDLLKSCTAHKRFYVGNSDGSVQEAMSALNCRLFFQGFTEGHNMVLAWGHLSGTVSDAAINELTMFCPPPDATVDLGIEKFLAWAKAHPDQWTNLPGVGLGSALQDAWPCPKSF